MTEYIGRAFLDGTKYANLEESDQRKGRPQPPLHTLLAGGARCPLPPAPPSADLGGVPLRDVLKARRSLRSYADASLTLEELSFLLWCTQGVKADSTDKYTLRPVPSAGARHAFETALLVQRVDGLAPGMYQYDAATHELVEWRVPADAAERWVSACLDQPMVQTGAVTFIWIADRYRMAWRYGERGLRYLYLDAGHVCQNLYLAAEALNAGACAIGAFDDDAVNELLGLDGNDRFVIYLASLGKRGS